MPITVERTAVDRIQVTSDFRDKDRVKEIPGASWDNNERVWHVPLSWGACKALRGVFGQDLIIGPNLNAWAAWDYQYRIQPVAELRARPLGDWYGDELLRPDQRVAVAFLQTAVHALLGDDMGSGKTPCTAVALRERGAAGLPALVVCPNTVKRGWRRELAKWYPGSRVEILKGTAPQRKKTIDRLRPCQVHGEEIDRTVVPAAPVKKKRRTKAEIEAEAAADAAGWDQNVCTCADRIEILIVNWENLRNHSRLAPFGSLSIRRCSVCDKTSDGKQTSCEWCLRDLNEINFKVVIADEAHRAKDPGSKQTRALWAIGHKKTVLNRWALTGTPIADTVEDLWSILHFLDPEEHPAKTKYIDRYALQSWNAFGGREIIGIRPDTKDEFFSVFEPRFLRRPRQLTLAHLKEPQRELREVELHPKQATLYDELAEEMLGRLDNDLLLASNPLTRTMRLNQAASSFLLSKDCERCGTTGQAPGTHKFDQHPDPEFPDYCRCAVKLDDPVHKTKCSRCAGYGKTVHPTDPSSKLDALEEDLEALGNEQVVVFAVSRQLIELAAARLDAKKITNVQITGAVSEPVRDTNVRDFRSGAARVCLVVIDAGGEGLDGLQVAQTGIFLQRHYSRLKNVQAEGRLLRNGQEGQVLFIDYRAVGTIENDKEILLAEKEGRFEEVMRDRDQLRRLYALRAKGATE